MNKKTIFIYTKTEKPKNCKIVVEDMTVFYKVGISKDDLDKLNEKDKNNVYKYLNEIEEEIKKLGKTSLLVYEDFND